MFFGKNPLARRQALSVPLPRPPIRPILKVAGPRGCAVEDEPKRRKWLWPLGVMATGLAGAAVLLFRGCWHGRMSWPIRIQAHSYQVCLGCGIKRLFDEKAFCSYGPYSYDLPRLIAWDRAHRPPAHPAPGLDVQRPAS